MASGDGGWPTRWGISTVEVGAVLDCDCRCLVQESKEEEYDEGPGAKEAARGFHSAWRCAEMANNASDKTAKGILYRQRMRKRGMRWADARPIEVSH